MTAVCKLSPNFEYLLLIRLEGAESNGIERCGMAVRHSMAGMYSVVDGGNYGCSSVEKSGGL